MSSTGMSDSAGIKRGGITIRRGIEADFPGLKRVLQETFESTWLPEITPAAARNYVEGNVNPESAVHTFCHALPQTWHQMGVILSATDSLNWLSEITGKGAGELTAELGDTLKTPSGVSFLPYLSGERTPHNDAAIRGAFVGLAHESSRSALTQAVLEGVAFAFRDSLEALRKAGTTLERVTAIGGGSRSRYWLKAIATALGIPVDVPADGDFGAAFGAARLGLIAATGADPLAVCTAPAVAATVEPEKALAAAFEDAYRRYGALYPAIRGTM